MWPNQGPHPPNPACPPPVNPAYPAMPIPQFPPGQNPVYPPGMNYPTTIPYMTPNQHPFPPAAPGPHAPFPGAGHPFPVPPYGGHQPGMDVHGHKKHKKMKKKGKKAHKVHKEHKHVKHGKDAEVVRSRDSSVLAECDVVVDVGGEYNPSLLRYDHHQRSFVESFNSLCPEMPWVTKLSSAGLIYLHYGRRVLAQLTELKQEDRQLEVLYEKMYENFVEEVDAVDNGISQCDGEARYSITTALSARVGHLNPHWNNTNQDTEEGFQKAMALVGAEFQDRLDYYMNAWLPARDVVQQAVQSRYQVDPSGEIVSLSQGGCPWKEHLFALEREMKVDVPIKFVLYPDQNGHWRVQCVPAGSNTFQNRLSLLEEWRGVRDDALSELSGISDCIFVHASGFIGGSKTQKGALEMAKRTLQTAPRSSQAGANL